MKNRTTLVTAISIVGVVLAGTTAAAANLGILSTTSDAELGSADPTVAVAPAASGAVAGQTELPLLATQPELLAYEIPDVGVVVVERSGSSLSVYQVEAPGWQWMLEPAGPQLAVSLSNGIRRIEFTASVVNGEVMVGVAERSASSNGSDDESFEAAGHEDEGHDDD